jgi:hypothetical protein
MWGDETDFRNIVATVDGGLLIYAHTRKAYKPAIPVDCTITNWWKPGNCDGDLWLLRLDASGKVLWEKTYFKMSAEDSAPRVIAALTDGTFVLSGAASQEPHVPLMLRFNANGDLITEERGTYVSAIGALPDGGVTLAGWPGDIKPLLSIFVLPPSALKTMERMDHRR